MALVARWTNSIRRRRRLPAADAPWRRALVVAVVLAGVIALVAALDGFEPLERNTTSRLFFSARAALGRDPSLDPRIKVLSLDDTTAGALRALDLSLDDWGLVLKKIATRKPAVIMLDKIFDKPYADDEIARFLATLATLGAPVVVDSFVSPEKIGFRSELARARGSFPLSRVTGAPLESLAWLPVRGGYLYGAPEPLAKAFWGIGHVAYDGNGYFEPILRVEHDAAVRHWSLMASGEFRIDRDGPIVDGRRVPVDGTGRALLNIGRRGLYADRAYSLYELVKRARSGGDVPIISEGDYVVILPAMYTGNTDFKETPLGQMPGGYIMLAQLSSVLTGEWLSRLPWPPGWAMLATLLGVLMGLSLPPTRFWIGLCCGAAVITATSLAAFVWLDVLGPWASPLALFAVGGLATFAWTESIARLEQVRIAKELETARLVQNSFFPSGPVSGDGMRVEGFYMPASECGGDFWGHCSPAPGVDYVIIGDATGHGMPAALVTAAVFSAWLSFFRGRAESGVDDDQSPSALLAAINEVLCAIRDPNTNMTASVVVVDRGSRRLRYANAGHPPPYHIHSGSDRIVPLATPGDMLGVDPGLAFLDVEVEIAPGDKIVLFSDGLIENKNLRGEQWGKRLLNQLLRKHRELDAGALKDAVVEGAAAHVGECQRGDDVTVVVVEIKSPASAAAAA